MSAFHYLHICYHLSRAEVASMKEEIEVSERRYKRHLMEQEKKTHENWMAFKNANKTIEDLNAETQVLRQQIIAAEAAQRTLTQAAALPQDRPRPPPPLPLPKGAQIPLLPLPLLNGLKGIVYVKRNRFRVYLALMT